MLRLFDKDSNDITNNTTYCDNPVCLGEPWCSAWGICKETALTAREPEQQAATMELQLEANIGEIELDYDQLFSELSQQFEESSTNPATHSSSTPLLPEPTSSTPLLIEPTSASYTRPKEKKRMFAAVKTDKEVQLARATGIPQTTLRDTKYCIGLWEAWRKYRESENGDTIQPIGELSRKDLEHWLTRVILEVSIIVVSTKTS